MKDILNKNIGTCGGMGYNIYGGITSVDNLSCSNCIYIYKAKR